MEVADIIQEVTTSQGISLALAKKSSASNNGCFGQVLVFDQFVVKKWICDPAYDAWLEFVEDHQDAPYAEHLPRVLWKHLGLRIAILERLYHRPYDENWKRKPLHSFDGAVGGWHGAVCPGWVRSLHDDMRDAGLFRDHNSDGHCGNWMVRADGHRRVLVVTDPISPS